MTFLPTTKKELENLSWDCLDFVLVTGDAYVDHPSFGAAIISRVLEREGFRVGILSQPSWQKKDAFTLFGEPKLGFLVTSGNIDSMVAHYTAGKRKRHDDKYTPGDVSGKRPDRAVTVYSQKIREVYPNAPIILGGIEASLRRLAHYDYWADSVFPSILIDSTADLLVYGMGERAIIEIAHRLNKGEMINDIKDIRGTVYQMPLHKKLPGDHIRLGSREKLVKEKKAYAIAAKLQMEHSDHIQGKVLVQTHGKVNVIQNPPALPLSSEELDGIYVLPYEYAYPKAYDALGGVKALDEVLFSITHNRGCFGGCHFCSIAYHQGRFVTARSHESVLHEAKKMTMHQDFKGYIHDVGGATANFRFPACKKQATEGLCKDKKCLYPKVCPNVKVDHGDYLSLLQKLRQLPKVKKVFVRSGIRYDYLLADKDKRFLQDLVTYHVSGQLRVAPEHSSKNVLCAMAKPSIGVYESFSKAFYRSTEKAGKEQYLVPYVMSSHPGSTIDDSVDLALWLRKNKIRPDQVQDFYPTPGTISTAMYYSGFDPYRMEKVYIPRSPHEKDLQRGLLQSYKNENKILVKEALKKVRRRDLQEEKLLLLSHGKPNDIKHGDVRKMGKKKKH